VLLFGALPSCLYKVTLGRRVAIFKSFLFSEIRTRSSYEDVVFERWNFVLTVLAVRTMASGHCPLQGYSKVVRASSPFWKTLPFGRVLGRVCQTRLKTRLRDAFVRRVCETRFITQRVFPFQVKSPFFLSGALGLGGRIPRIPIRLFMEVKPLSLQTRLVAFRCHQGLVSQR